MMRMQQRSWLPLALLVLTACVPISTGSQSASPTGIPLSTINAGPEPATRSLDELTRIIWASDPELAQYDPQSEDYARFPEAVRQLGAMGIEGVDGADDLAVAIRFPRPDSYLAAQSLLAMGPEITGTTIPILFDDLERPNPEVRIYAAILLASVGPRGSCAVGNIHTLLWASDPRVRSAGTIALEDLTGRDLVDTKYQIVIEPTFLANRITPDLPNGEVAGRAREWWLKEGSKINWHPRYGICDA